MTKMNTATISNTISNTSFDSLHFFEGNFSMHPVEFFQQLYVPNLTRAEAEKIIAEHQKNDPREGIFILRNASNKAALKHPMPDNMTTQYAISYYNNISMEFNHLLICSDNSYNYWAVLIDENEYQQYGTLRNILYDIPCIRKTMIKNALVKI